MSLKYTVTNNYNSSFFCDSDPQIIAKRLESDDMMLPSNYTVTLTRNGREINSCNGRDFLIEIEVCLDVIKQLNNK